MKKFILSIGIIAATLCCMLGFAACGSSEADVHSHKWGEWQTVTEATCTEEGLEKHTCTECNEEETRPIAKAEHSYPGAWETVKSATCTEEGLEQRACTVCNTPQTRTVAMIAHNEIAVDKLEATCLLAGHEAGTECSVCGTKLSGFQTIPALGHSFGETEHIKTPTCTDQGLDRKTCTRQGCEAVEDTVLEMKPHTIVEFGENRDATCTETGSKKGERCSVCEHIIKDEETVPALGHQMQAPVHYDNGGVNYHKGSCSRCGTSDVDEPCNFDVVKTAATCTKAEHHVHTCPTCHYEYEHDEGSPLGHNFGDWHFDVKTYDMSLRDRDGAETVIRQHIRTCSNAGHETDPEYPEVEACTEERDGEPVAATCIMSGYTNYKCTECENRYTGSRVNALGHDWAKNEDGSVKYTHETYQGMEVHYRTCTRENCDRPNGKDTYYACYYTSSAREKATCTKGATLVRVCDYCKYRTEEETSAPLGHAYGAWTHDDATSGETSKHYRVCGREECGNREEEDCRDSMKSSGTLPTCQYEGTDIQVCEKCRYTQNAGALPKLQHDVTGQPYLTDRAKKSHYQVCKRANCGERVYEECPYTTSVKAMTCTTDEETTYTCPICEDSYTLKTAQTKGHTVKQFTESDAIYHKGQCVTCGENVSVLHDFSESNICAVCRTDGLTYAFESGSDNTRARVIRTVRGGVYYYIDTPKIVIPATVNIDGRGEVPVVGIASDAFFGNRYIEEAELPLSIEYIGYHAFQGCSNLADVHFTGHEPGEHNVTDCKLNRIENGAFRDCTSLTNAILPATLQYIGQEAFRGCTKLAQIDIPELVTEIEDHAFTDTAYFLASENWEPDGVLYIGKHLIRARTSLSGTYTVNADVVSISAEAFMDCIYLETIELPATLKAIDRDAFKGCEALTTVVFNGTFAQYLGIRFDNNEASPMHIATALTIAGESGTPTIPEEATVIPAGAFRGSDITSIVIPAGVTSIGANAFADCAQLTSIKFARGSKIISIGADVVKNTPFYNTEGNWTDGVLYLRDEDGVPVALVAVDKTKVTAAYVPYEDENFGGSAKQIVIESGTRVVAPEAFKDFTELRYVEVPDTVIFFGEHVFEGCSGLDRVNFRGAGRSWFCYAANIGRVYADAAVYGGADGKDYEKQRDAANMFKVTYPLHWKRLNG